MTLKTWSFSKKKNSTAQPSGSSDSYTVRLKEDTSIEKPVFIIGTGIDADINYCQFAGKYYFIDDIEVLTNDQVALHCSLDVLATHKSAIGSYTCFVDRCSNASYYNPMIRDFAVSASQKVIREAVESAQLSNNTSTDGVYVLGVIGGYGSSTAGISTYVLTPSELGEVLDFMFTDSHFGDIFADSVVKSFFNPFQYIVFLRWYPFTKAPFGAMSTYPVKFGWWSTSGQYTRCDNVTMSFGQTVTLPSGYYNDFRSYDNNYTQLDIEIPTVGAVKLDPSQFSATGIQLLVSVNVDIATGTSVVRLETVTGGALTTRSVIGVYSGQMGASIPVGQVNGEMGSLVSSVSGFAAGVMGGDAGMALSGVQGVVGSYNPPPSMLGTYGSRAYFAGMTSITLTIRCYETGELLTDRYGRPCCKNITLGNAPGFIKCTGASISLAAPDTEVEAVNNYLNTGFYYE